MCRSSTMNAAKDSPERRTPFWPKQAPLLINYRLISVCVRVLNKSAAFQELHFTIRIGSESFTAPISLKSFRHELCFFDHFLKIAECFCVSGSEVFRPLRLTACCAAWWINAGQVFWPFFFDRNIHHFVTMLYERAAFLTNLECLSRFSTEKSNVCFAV